MQIDSLYLILFLRDRVSDYTVKAYAGPDLSPFFCKICLTTVTSKWCTVFDFSYFLWLAWRAPLHCAMLLIYFSVLFLVFFSISRIDSSNYGLH